VFCAHALQVVVMTHAYGDCGGVRYLTNGLKVTFASNLPKCCTIHLRLCWLCGVDFVSTLCLALPPLSTTLVHHTANTAMALPASDI
jgi:hypothetical protein